MKRLLTVTAVLCMMLLCVGCGGPARETVFAMDTVMDLQIWGGQADEGLQAVKDHLSQLEHRWSVTQERSALSQLNRGEQADLTAQEQELLIRLEALQSRTGGTFDPKMYRAALAWGFYTDTHRIPDEKELADALAHPQWDLGGALKGYGGDLAVQCLSRLDIDRAILNLGGNIQTYGEKPDGRPWTVGIQNPDGGDYIATVEVTGTASVVTSGDYRRYFEQDGVRYHHILDPKTGAPARSGLRSVTVICRDGLTADALSTALFVMGLEQGADHWRQSDDFEAVFITQEGVVYATEGAVLSGCDYEVIKR